MLSEDFEVDFGNKKNPSILTTMWKNSKVDWTSLEFQQLISERIFHDPSVLKYPPSLNYRLKILKQFISHVESEGKEVNEDLLKLYIGLLNSKQSSNTYYRTYEIFVQSNRWDITLKMAEEFNLVGLAMWDACFFLAEYMISRTEIFREKKCLELGSGVGFLGILAAKLGAERVVLTDMPRVIPNLEDNVQINMEGNEHVFVVDLNWEDYDAQHLNFSEFFEADFIMGSDLLYDPPLIDALVPLLNLLLKRNKSCECVLASKKRSKTTFDYFLQRVQASGLEVTYISPELSPIFEYDRDQILLTRLSIKDM